jgi:acetylglutamate kinase
MKSVIKLGGSVLVDNSLRLKLVYQISKLRRHGLNLVLVHGGGKQIAEMLTRLHIESRFHDGLRITDAAARDVIQMVLAGKVGKDLVADFARINVPAVSFAGGDALSFLSTKLKADDGTDLGFVGQITRTDGKLIDAVLGINAIPVIACLGLSTHDFSYHNINGDQMAAAVAPACQAEELIFVTDVGGVKDEHGATIPNLNRERINELLDSGVAHGGMRPKLRACLSALDAGVKRILIVGAAEENALLRACLQQEAVGTVIS